MRPPVFNHQQYTDLEADYMILKAENERLRKELASLAIESIEREKTLAKLEAEVMVWAKAEQEGRLVVLPCKCGECEKYKSVSPKCGNCNRTTVIQHPEDYCNHGIRRENNEN